MAEYVLGAFLHFSRGFHLGYRDQWQHRFDHRTYEPIILRDKTVCIVGAGGHRPGGRKAVRLLDCECSGRGECGPRAKLPGGVCASRIPACFERIAAGIRFRRNYLSMDQGDYPSHWPRCFFGFAAVLVNISRGEIIDEEALLALEEGKLRGVALRLSRRDSTSFTGYRVYSG